MTSKAMPGSDKVYSKNSRTYRRTWLPRRPCRARTKNSRTYRRTWRPRRPCRARTWPRRRSGPRCPLHRRRPAGTVGLHFTLTLNTLIYANIDRYNIQKQCFEHNFNILNTIRFSTGVYKGHKT